MTDIQLTEVTTGDITGTGVFDKLMVAVKSHITEEYDNGRIKGSDYANLYLGALQGVLSQSVEYVLRVKLTEAQVDGAIKDIDLKSQQIAGMILEDTIKQAQNTKDLELKTAQITSINIEHVIKDKEAATLGLDNVTKNREEARKNNANYVYELAYKDIL